MMKKPVQNRNYPRVQATVTQATRDALDEAVRVSGCSVSEIVDLAIAEYLAGGWRRPPPA